ncbi:hypothetical protein HK27_14340 [Acetobacter orientalis]|nr:hypothetical protein HK27_14340 [Acetobacter orientalis]
MAGERLFQFRSGRRSLRAERSPFGCWRPPDGCEHPCLANASNTQSHKKTENDAYNEQIQCLGQKKAVIIGGG